MNRADEPQALKDLLGALDDLSRSFFDLAWDAVTLLDEDGTVLAASASWERILGVPPAQMVGRPLHEFAAEGCSASNLEHLRSMQQTGEGEGVICSFQHRAGRVVRVDFSHHSVGAGARRLMLTIGREITGRLEAQRQLEVSEARYRSLVESLPDIVSSRTRDGRSVFLSGNVEAITGFTRDELVHLDRVFSDRVHPDDRPVLEAARAELLATGKPLDQEARFQCKDGTWISLRTRSRAVERDGVQYLDSIISDVTAIRSTYTQMLQAQKLEAVGLLTGGVAHDFNNILTAILVSARFLLRDLGPDDPRRQDADEILQAAERAAGLTRQLLAFSRKQVLEPRRVDLNEVISGLVKMLRRLIGEDIELEVRLADTLGSVIADPGQIEQVIMNLVVNARDAMPRGGRLVLSTAMSPDGKWAQLSIRDTGCGIDEATQRRIFEPFFTTKGVGKGTGLGLSTCYGIVAQSNGQLTVESKPGLGSTFCVRLPVAPPAPEVATPTPPGRLKVLIGHERLLLVEDDAPARAVVSRILRDLGYCVLEADGPGEAERLATLHPGQIDLLLTDVVMPQGGGLACAALVERLCPQVRTLYMSGYTDHPALVARAVAHQLTFIQKPFTPEALAWKVRQLLDR